MPYLVAAVIVVGLLCLLDLLLTVGVVRRLRAHAALLSVNGPGAGHPSGRGAAVPVGTTVGDFVATTTDGDRISRAELPAPAVVGFLSPGCAPCEELMPELAGYAAAVPGGRDQVLVVIVGAPEEARAAVSTLAPVARVVVEGSDGPVSLAFGVDGYPALCVVDADGRVAASGSRIRDLPALAGV